MSHLSRFLLVAVLWCVLVFTGCTQSVDVPTVTNDPAIEPPMDSPIPEPDAAGPSDPQQPPISVEAADFWASFQSDPQQFAQKYGNQTVEIHGTAHQVGEEFPGQTYVALKTDDLVGILCRFDNDPQPWATVVSGQEVTLRGKCPNSDFLASNAVVEHCEFVSVGKGPKVQPASELATKYASDRAGAWDAFQKQTLIVAGTVQSIEDRSGAKVLILAGTDDAAVECWFNSRASAQVATTQAGDEVKVAGELISSTSEDDRNLPLSKCLLINKPPAVAE